MKLKNSKLFWGDVPQTPLVASASLLQAAERWAGPGYEATRKRSVPTLCPGIGRVLATPLITACYTRVHIASWYIVQGKAG